MVARWVLAPEIEVQVLAGEPHLLQGIRSCAAPIAYEKNVLFSCVGQTVHLYVHSRRGLFVFQF